MGRKLKDPVKQTSLFLTFDNYFFIRTLMADEGIKTLTDAINKIISEYKRIYTELEDERNGNV